MNVAASILHYNSINSLEQVIEAVRKQTHIPSKILIIDNGSTVKLSSTQEKYPELEIIELSENKGVGHGHNFGWRYLIQKYSPDYIWALEHDSIPDPNNLEILLKEYNQASEDVMALNSIEKNSFDYENKTYFKVRIPNIVKLENKNLIPSYYGGLSFNGVLIPVGTLEKIGFLREDFFIGFEDIDFTNRVYRAGGKVLRVTATFVNHDSYKKHNSFQLGNKVFLFPGNDPIREYYSFRNSLVLHERPGLFLLKVGFSVLYILIFRGRKIANIAAKFLGYRDAVMGRLGKREYRVLSLKW